MLEPISLYVLLPVAFLLVLKKYFGLEKAVISFHLIQSDVTSQKNR